MKKVALEELDSFAQDVLSSLPGREDNATLVALSGDLGAGKTTFVQTVARALGVSTTVQSPTYVLMKSYPINFKKFKKLVHIDAYRLQTPEEFTTLKPEEFLLDPANLVFIEWPEKVGTLLPIPDKHITFSSEETLLKERYITMI